MKKFVLALAFVLSLFGCLQDSPAPSGALPHLSSAPTTVIGTEETQPTAPAPIPNPGNGQYVISDSLQGTTKGQIYGGNLGANGYRPGAGTNHILYRLPRTVRAGYVEVEVRGMDPSRIGSGKDHGFLAMYDGRTIGEPISMFDDFKQNYYRWNVHWRQNSKAMKCVITCASPNRSRDGSTKPVFPPVSGHDHKRDWSEEPLGNHFNWNPSKWHTLKVEWRGGSFRAFVDGVLVWQASGPYDYAPVDHRIWLGSGPGKYSSELSGITYRNFRVGAY